MKISAYHPKVVVLNQHLYQITLRLDTCTSASQMWLKKKGVGADNAFGMALYVESDKVSSVGVDDRLFLIKLLPILGVNTN